MRGLCEQVGGECVPQFPGDKGSCLLVMLTAQWTLLRVPGLAVGDVPVGFLWLMGETMGILWVPAPGSRQL